MQVCPPCSMNGKDRRAEANGMQYSTLCKELNKFIREDVPLSVIKDCFCLYWNRVHEKGDTDENIAQAEILQVAVETYENGHFSEEDLRKTILHYSSEVNLH